jgi:anti-sigma regulatory factor (Ser/Thr protein kinase)
MSGGRWRLEADLPVTGRAAATARGLLDQFLTVWGQTRLAEDARLVISELVTNAIRHAPDSGDLHLDIDGDQRGNLYLAVHDGSAMLPLAREPDTEEETGRGLHVVDQLTTRWGTDHQPGSGKRVWVELNAPD